MYKKLTELSICWVFLVIFFGKSNFYLALLNSWIGYEEKWKHYKAILGDDFGFVFLLRFMVDHGKENMFYKQQIRSQFKRKRKRNTEKSIPVRKPTWSYKTIRKKMVRFVISFCTVVKLFSVSTVCVQCRVVDPHWFNADPDPAVFLIADLDPDPVPNPGFKKDSQL